MEISRLFNGIARSSNGPDRKRADKLTAPFIIIFLFGILRSLQKNYRPKSYRLPDVFVSI
jgi:hypothetical protein